MRVLVPEEKFAVGFTAKPEPYAERLFGVAADSSHSDARSSTPFEVFVMAITEIPSPVVQSVA
jgi:hypothetical protein